MIGGVPPAGQSEKPLKVMIGEPLVMPLDAAAGWFFHGTRFTSSLSTKAYPPLNSFTARWPRTFVSVKSSLLLCRVTWVRYDGCLVGSGGKTRASRWGSFPTGPREGALREGEKL